MAKVFDNLTQRDDRLLLATALRLKMEEYKWSIRDVAWETHLSRGTIANLLDGTSSPTLETCYKLMRGMEMPTLLSDLEMLV
jgi:DNA-binding phage protein